MDVEQQRKTLGSSITTIVKATESLEKFGQTIVDPLRKSLEGLREVYVDVLSDELGTKPKEPRFFRYHGKQIPLNDGETYVGTITYPGYYGGYHLINTGIYSDGKLSYEEALRWANEQCNKFKGYTLPMCIDLSMMHNQAGSTQPNEYFWAFDTCHHIGHRVYNPRTGNQSNVAGYGEHAAMIVRKLYVQGAVKGEAQ